MTIEEPFTHVPPYRPEPEDEKVRQAAQVLSGARRPVIVAGGGVTASQAQREVVQLAEMMSIPVATSLNAKGTIPDDHPLSVGVCGSYSRWCANRVVAEAVTYVNAGDMAEERGLDVRTVSSPVTTDYLNTITLRSDDLTLAGTLVGMRAEPRIVMIDDHILDVPPADHMVIVRNADVPGMIGVVGTVLGDAGVNVADMAVGQSEAGSTAVMVLSTDRSVDADVLDDLASREGILSVHGIDLV